MGLFNGLLGNASTVGNREIEKEIGDFLIEDERVELGFKLVRDLIIFTDRRLMIVDKQGLTGKKSDYHSIPYKSISHFSVETAGHFDLDAELKIWISGASLPAIDKTFKSDDSIFAIQKALAAAVCK